MEVSSFVLYTNSKELVDKLSDEQAGALFKAILAYTTGCEVEEMDLATEITFTSIKQYIDENYKKRQEKAERNRRNGSLGGRPKKVTSDDTDKKLEKETAKEEKKELKSAETEKIPYQEIIDKFHELCPSLPKVMKLTEARRKAIRGRCTEYKLDDIYQAFELVEKSDFLSGRNGKWSGCNFDWIMTQSHFLKIMEGVYKNKGGGSNELSKGHSEQAHHKLFADEYI